MLKMTLEYFELQKLARDNPKLHGEIVAAAASRGVTLESTADILANKGYTSWTVFINSTDDLPPDVLKAARFEAPEVLKMFTPDGSSCRGIDVGRAIASHQVHLPGNELLRIREVVAREDYCTDELQRDLNEGYRIIAVVPRVGQRRPDYVLGRNANPLESE